MPRLRLKMKKTLLFFAASFLHVVVHAQAPPSASGAQVDHAQGEGAPGKKAPKRSLAKNAASPALSPAEAKGIDELTSRVWEAVREKSAEKLVDCYDIEKRFDTAANREGNLKRAAILLENGINEIDVLEIPPYSLAEIIHIQTREQVYIARYSLLPKKLLRLSYPNKFGKGGQRFLIGEKDGKWHIVTLGGQTT